MNLLKTAEYKRILSNYPTGVGLLTVIDEGENIGVTINSFASVSLDPPIILFSLKENSRFYEKIIESESFNLYFLSIDQEDVATFFSKNSTSTVSQDILGSATAVLHCQSDGTLRKGDHTIFFGKVLSGMNQPKSALAYYRSSFTGFDYYDTAS